MLHLTYRQRHYLVFKHLVPAILVNFLINFGLGWVFFHTREQVPLWEALSFTALPSSIAMDLIPTTFFLVFFTGLIVSRQVQQHVRSGQVAPTACPAGLERIGHLCRPVTSLKMAVGITLVLVPATVLVLYWNRLDMLSLGQFILFKAVYASVLAALFTPVVVLNALGERR